MYGSIDHSTPEHVATLQAAHLVAIRAGFAQAKALNTMDLPVHDRHMADYSTLTDMAVEVLESSGGWNFGEAEQLVQTWTNEAKEQYLSGLEVLAR